jgi:hypothetical protein
MRPRTSHAPASIAVNMNISKIMTTVTVTEMTKSSMDRWKTEGQSYDEFLLQILEVWNKRIVYKQ